jgi:hypothetical protein
VTQNLSQQQYIQQVIQAYLQMPDTPQKARTPDRRLAAQLWECDVSLNTVQQALLLASVRRITRPGDAPRLAPIRSLYYFNPVIEEILQQPLPKGYGQYLLNKLKRFQRLNSIKEPAAVQKNAFPNER